MSRFIYKGKCYYVDTSYSEEFSVDVDEALEKCKQLKPRQPDTALVEFAHKVIKEVCWGYPELNACTIQDLAEELGLVIPHTATKDDVDEESDFEVGDMIYVFSDKLKEKD